MDIITIEAEVGRDHRLVDALPPEVPVGRVKLVIEPVEAAQKPAPILNPAREAARAKLLAAGALNTSIHAPEGTVDLPPQELLRIGTLPAGSPSFSDLLDEDRGPR